MKLTWSKKAKKRSLGAVSNYPNLPFDQETAESQSRRQCREDDSERGRDGDRSELRGYQAENHGQFDFEAMKLAESFRSQGDKLAEEGKYREALGKWETALNLMPENAALHEQKAQVLLELGDAWKAVKSATRATELDPSWAEAWTTLGRAQLNFGEPDSAIESFERALALKPDSREAKDDLHTAKQLVKKREQLHSSGLSTNSKRFLVGDKTKSS
ncbi:PREDICTED: tetratricopeptide repeat protein 33 [Tarenaya hassleriana]|uniref:tetratricopeptide repeat protein 33 n=1 Tax=Tarenaya hassleriana TaxID=28532 RepID=UPI00053C84AD|nr:PREDICTED: tetratricopeptide repeat protein 33 [Tarenaya hassleriana]